MPVDGASSIKSLTTLPHQDSFKKRLIQVRCYLSHRMQVAIAVINSMVVDSCTLVRVLKLNNRSFLLYKDLTSQKKWLNTFLGKMASHIGFIEAFQLLADLRYVFHSGDPKDKSFRTLNQDIREKKYWNIASCLGFFAADIGGFALWLHDLKLVDLGRASQALVSRFPVLKNVTRFGLVRPVVGFVAFSYAAMTVHNIKEQKLVTSADKRQLALDIAWGVSEVAAASFVVIAGTTFGLPVALALGITAAGLGLTAFIHKQTLTFDKKLKAIQA